MPDAALEAFVDRVLGPVARSGPLVESLRALLDSGCRWSEAADRLGVHRHTLRYRMERLEEQTGRHPDRPAERMELWLAVKAVQALHGPRERGAGATPYLWGRSPAQRACERVWLAVYVAPQHVATIGLCPQPSDRRRPPELPCDARARCSKSEGFEVVGEAEDGETAIRMARELQPEVVLLDVQLPDLDGFEVASRVTGGERPARRARLEPRRRRLRLEDRGLGASGFIAKAELCGPALADLLG